MQNRYRRLLLVVSVSLWVVVSLAEHALALAPTCIEFNIPTTDSVPTGITVGPDGALWFTEEFKNKIGRITTDGVITEYPIPTPDSNPADITAGAAAAPLVTPRKRVGKPSSPPHPPSRDIIILQPAPLTSPHRGPGAPASAHF